MGSQFLAGGPVPGVPPVVLGRVFLQLLGRYFSAGG